MRGDEKLKNMPILMDVMRGRLRRKNKKCQKALDHLIYQSIIMLNRRPIVGEVALLSIVYKLIDGILNKDYKADRLQSIYIAIYDQLYPTSKGYDNEQNSD